MRRDKNDCACPHGHGVWYVCPYSTPTAQQTVRVEAELGRHRMKTDPTFWAGVPAPVRVIFEALIGAADEV